MKRECLALAMVRTASLLVPHSTRAGWIDEWRAELWHLCRAPGEQASDPLECSLGAWADAMWIRSESLRHSALWLVQPRSAQRCGLGLCAAALAAMLMCIGLPRTRRILLPSPYPDPGNLVVLASNGDAGTRSPSIRFDDYREWTSDASGLFASLAWYRPAIKDVHLIRHRSARLNMAEGSQNLLEVLGLPQAVLARTHPSFRGPRLILTRSAWKHIYRGDPAIIGQLADIDGSPVLIAGVMPDQDWTFPGGTTALLLVPPPLLAQLAPDARGFGVARIRPSAFPAPRNGWRWMTETTDDVTRRYECISANYLRGQPGSILIFAVLLAVLALPATTALPLGDVPRQRGALPWAAHVRRWFFLASKFALVVVIASLLSIVLAAELGAGEVAAVYIQSGSSFPLLLLGLRWALQDQRRRCPQCLLRLSNPARVGQPSCNFLAWNGTELFCARGHGLLHIPELPTSWFSTQRWLCLDASWRSLFAESSTPPAA